MSLAKTAPSPRSTVRRPNYPVVLAASAMLVLAACGGKVEGDGSDGEAAGSAGQGPVPMPTGAGSGGSWDPGTGGSVDTGGSGGSDEPGGMGGYSGMPSGAGAGGSYETGGSGGQDFDAGVPSEDAGVFDPEYEAVMDDPCVSACVKYDAEAWAVLLGTLAPCLCAPGTCQQVCADTLCADGPLATSKSCGGCALASADQCMNQVAACLSNPSCGSVVQCLLACQ
jgi:hypothetical protein